MRQKHLRVFLEYRRDRHDRHVICDRVERLERIRAHEEIELAGDQLDAVIDVGAARNDRDIEAVTLVGAVGDGLIEPAVFGLGHPVGAERNLVEIGGALGHDRPSARDPCSPAGN